MGSVLRKPAKLKPAKADTAVTGIRSLRLNGAMFPSFAIVVLTLFAFWPATRCGFVDYDDTEYVTSNPHVQAGLNSATITWAFAGEHAGNWHPLTWISHAVDCQIFGLNPWGHHLVSVLFHVINALLVFTLMRVMTRESWKSFAVALLFALHPLRVESVVWVAERKDVLSGFFGLLCLLFYVRYTRLRDTSENEAKRRKSRGAGIYYGLCLATLAIGLMSKAMLVTWPLVMLLLDVWPLKRMGNQTARRSPMRLVVEKIPFLCLSVIVGLLTYRAQEIGGAIKDSGIVGLSGRISSILLAYGGYLSKSFWPGGLAVFYPTPNQVEVFPALAVAVLMFVLFLAGFVFRNREPACLVGWLWFVGTLVPIVGFIRFGWQSFADRYTYLPSVGLWISIVWGLGHAVAQRQSAKKILLPLGVLMVGIMFSLTQLQIEHWRDSASLFNHALAVTQDNFVAHNNLGVALDTAGHTDAAVAQFKTAISLKPDYAQAYFNLGTARLNQHDAEAAAVQFREAIRLKPGYAMAHNNLGFAYDYRGQTNEAVAAFREAVRWESGNVSFHRNLAAALFKQGRHEEALAECEKAIELDENDVPSLNNLGGILIEVGKVDEAMLYLRRALQVNPSSRDVRLNLAVALLRKNQAAIAVDELKALIQDYPEDRQIREVWVKAQEMDERATRQ